jgi:hypothetical protein
MYHRAGSGDISRQGEASKVLFNPVRNKSYFRGAPGGFFFLLKGY